MRSGALRKTPYAVDYHARQVANNRLADSLGGTNHVILGLSIAGGLLASGGLVWALLNRSGAPSEGHDAGHPRLDLGISFGGPSAAGLTWSETW